MVGLEWKILLRWDDLGVPLFQETSVYLGKLERPRYDLTTDDC